MFEIISKLFSSEDGADYTSYGVRCGESEFHHICNDLKSIGDLVRRLEEGCFSLEHLEDVIEDWVAE